MHGSARDSFAQISVANPSAILARQPRSGQPPEDPLLPRRQEGEYAFLVNAGVSAATLVIAGGESRKFAATIHDILISAGHISPTAYASALADRLGVTLASWNANFGRHKHDRLHDSPLEQGLPARIGDRAYHVLCAENGSPDELRRQVAALQARGLDVALASRMRIHEAIEVLTGSERLDHAVNSLARQQAEFSAAGPIWIWQVIAAAIVVGLVVGGFSILPDATIAALSAVMALPFLCVTVLRMIALREVIALASNTRVSRQRTSRPCLRRRCPFIPSWYRCFAKCKRCRAWCNRCKLSTIPGPKSKSCSCSRRSTWRCRPPSWPRSCLATSARS